MLKSMSKSNNRRGLRELYKKNLSSKVLGSQSYEMLSFNLKKKCFEVRDCGTQNQISFQSQYKNKKTKPASQVVLHIKFVMKSRTQK